MTTPPTHRTEADDGIDSATLERALRLAHAGQGPDLSTVLARSSASERGAALAKAEAAVAPPASPRYRSWAAAALMLLGIGVVAFALKSTPKSATRLATPPPQDPAETVEVFADSWLELLQLLCTTREVKVHAQAYHHHNATSLRRIDIAGLSRAIEPARLQDWVAGAVAQGRGFRPEDLAAMGEDDAAEVAQAVAEFGKTIRQLDHVAHLELSVAGGTLATRFISDGTFAILSWDGLGSLWMPVEAGGMDELLATLDRARREICVIAASPTDLANAPAGLRQLVCAGDANAALADHLGRFTELTHLRVEGAFDGEILAAAGAMQTLEDLAWIGTEPADFPLDVLHECRRLRSLRLESFALEPSTLTVFDQLRTLHLLDCRLRGPGMAVLATLPLDQLELAAHGLEARDVAAFARMRGVRRLAWTQGQPEVARAGVRAIAAAGAVRRLELVVPPDVELPELLRGLATLRVLDVSKIPDRPERIDALRAALPGVRLILP